MQRIALSTALAVSLSALSASPALAKRLGHPRKGASRWTQPAAIFRVTSFHFAGLKRAAVSGRVALLRMAPNTTYKVSVLESPAPTMSFTPIGAGALTTDDVGNGNLAIKVECIPGSTTFSFAVSAQNLGQTFASPAVELD